MCERCHDSGMTAPDGDWCSCPAGQQQQADYQAWEDDYLQALDHARQIRKSPST
jgi:hypothetical protein